MHSTVWKKSYPTSHELFVLFVQYIYAINITIVAIINVSITMILVILTLSNMFVITAFKLKR